MAALQNAGGESTPNDKCQCSPPGRRNVIAISQVTVHPVDSVIHDCA